MELVVCREEEYISRRDRVHVRLQLILEGDDGSKFFSKILKKVVAN